MENASKALIIAGAILLSIAIIGIGMYVYQMASSTIGSANMSAQEVAAYNAEFDRYEGTQTGTTVRALCDAVRQHNAYQEDNSKLIQLTTGTPLTGQTVGNDADTKGTTSTEITAVKNKINAGGRYNVTFSYTSSGLIKGIDATLK